MSEHMPAVNKQVPIPKVRRKAKLRVPATVRRAAEGFKRAYKAVHGVLPELRWDGTWVRITGQTEGVSPRRLREMTTQLARRVA